jgi:hypothetical protein
MDDEESPEPDPGPAAVPATESGPAEPSFHADEHHLAPRLEWRLRRLAGRKATYRGPIVACTRGWVSRDARWHVFAARFLDFALLTPEHLVLCSTGFFTRRPRRQVLREPLGRLFVTTIGPAPVRAVRIVGDFSRPIRIELRDSPDAAAFVRELIALTPSDQRPRGDPWATDEMEPPPGAAVDAE